MRKHTKHRQKAGFIPRSGVWCLLLVAVIGAADYHFRQFFPSSVHGGISVPRALAAENAQPRLLQTEEQRIYDQLGRLVQYTGPGGSEKYTYIGASARRRTVTRTASGEKPVTRSILYDGYDAAAVYTGDSPALESLFLTPYLDENLSLTMVRGAQAGSYYYSHDGMGSVRHLTDMGGGVNNRHDYTAFGEVYHEAIALAQPYGYTGRETNPISGDMHYRHRNYNQGTGRFASRDPLLYSDGSNLYSYTANRPYRYADPFGLKLDICGPDKFKQKVKDALTSLCSGISYAKTQNECTPVHMTKCPDNADELCRGLYDLINNDRNNYIAVRGEDPRLSDINTVALFPQKAYLPEGSTVPAEGSGGAVMMRDKDLLTDRDQYDYTDGFPQRDGKIILPWGPAIAHELGHLSQFNRGNHPTDIRTGEKLSVRWENLAWEKIGARPRRVFYGIYLMD